MSSNPSQVERVEARLVAAGNAALRTGAFWALLIAAGNAVLLPILMITGAAVGLEEPWLFTLAAGGSCSVVLALARRGRVRGIMAYVVFLPFVSLPTLFFLVSHATMPSGAATFITGPVSYLYFVVIVVTGFLFDFRLSTVAGIVAAAGYALCFGLAQPGLLTVSAADPMLLQDLTAPAIYAVKSVMMVAGGITVGGLAWVARRLVVQLLQEERNRERVSRLFGQYVSAEVKDRILADPDVQRGERREVVVLFSDVRGFSTYSEGRPPEEVVRRLNEYFDAMVEAIARQGGVVDKFVGDAVMAVFDGVLPHASPAAAAVEAARDMRRRLRALNAEWRAAGEAPFDNGIGIHAGPVVQGAIGSEHRRDFTVIGDAVNTASRVEGLTKRYERRILVTEGLRAHLPASLRAECEPLGETQVRGRSAPVALFGLADEAAPTERAS